MSNRRVKLTLFFSVWFSVQVGIWGHSLLASSLLAVTDFTVRCTRNLLYTKIPAKGLDVGFRISDYHTSTFYSQETVFPDTAPVGTWLPRSPFRS